MSKSFFKSLGKLELLIIIFGLILNLSIAQYSLNKFDKHVTNNSGETYNLIVGSDLIETWSIADNFRKKLSTEKNLWSSLPSYDRFLSSIIVGYYYHLIDKEIYELNSSNEKVVKIKNYKFGILLIQIFLYYIAIFIIFAIKKKFIKNIIFFFYHF